MPSAPARAATLATTSASLSGDNGQFTAALVNNQYNANDITGQVQSPILGIVVKGAAVQHATLTANGNSFSASAYGNQGSNSLSSAFTNATLGDGAASWANPSGYIDQTAQLNQSTAAMALTSNQKNEGSTLTATVADGQMGVLVGASGGDVSNTPVTVNGNTSSATAVVNQVTNTLDPGVGNLSTTGGSATQVASLGNYQLADTNTVTSEISLGTAVGQAHIGAQFAGNVTGSPVTVSNNIVSAFAAGNVAQGQSAGQFGNSLMVTGTNFSPTAITGTNGLTTVGTTSDSVTAAYELHSFQQSLAGSRTATVTNGTVGTAALGTVSDSPLTVSGNQISADARDNYATNGLGLSGFSTLTTTAALLNDQLSNACAHQHGGRHQRGRRQPGCRCQRLGCDRVGQRADGQGHRQYRGELDGRECRPTGR